MYASYVYVHMRCRLSCDPYPSLQHVAAIVASQPGFVAQVLYGISLTANAPHGSWLPSPCV